MKYHEISMGTATLKIGCGNVLNFLSGIWVKTANQETPCSQFAPATSHHSKMESGSGPGCIKHPKITWEFPQLFPAFWKVFSHRHCVSNAL